ARAFFERDRLDRLDHDRGLRFLIGGGRRGGLGGLRGFLCGRVGTGRGVGAWVAGIKALLGLRLDLVITLYSVGFVLFAVEQRSDHLDRHLLGQQLAQRAILEDHVLLGQIGRVGRVRPLLFFGPLLR